MNEINSQISQQLSGYRRTIDTSTRPWFLCWLGTFPLHADDVKSLEVPPTPTALRLDAESEKSQVERLS